MKASTVTAVLLGLVAPSFAAPTAIDARAAPFNIIVTDPNVWTLRAIFLLCNGATTSDSKIKATYSLAKDGTLTCTQPINVPIPGIPPPVGFADELGGPLAAYYGKDGITTAFSVDEKNQISFTNEKIGKATWVARPSAADGTVYGLFGGHTTPDYVVVTLAASPVAWGGATERTPCSDRMGSAGKWPGHRGGGAAEGAVRANLPMDFVLDATSADFVCDIWGNISFLLERGSKRAHQPCSASRRDTAMEASENSGVDGGCELRWTQTVAAAVPSFPTCRYSSRPPQGLVPVHDYSEAGPLQVRITFSITCQFTFLTKLNQGRRRIRAPPRSLGIALV
ncbi:hypothetical protein V493_02930 [Pseudogymnoascus sp. VKM F-4281 (FW-2241)]|nr:hypothetical protein V493_02930 [Pseudogymnoascus sp. VKM F-4281 (FW-2241)]